MTIANPSAERPGGLLSDYHHRLELKCRFMLGAAYADDPRGLGTAWNELESELLDHMAAEEDVILPGYATYAPEDAHRIRAEHARIRSLVTPIGVDVDLHEVHVARLRLLVDALEAHSASEDAAMYPWAAEHIVLASERLLSARIEHWVARTETS